LYRVLAQELPYYAVPQIWVELGEIKMNAASGKADRKSLPAPPPAPPTTKLPEGFRLPMNGSAVDMEKALCLVFEEVLGAMQGTVHCESNFFELGGHSLNATRLLAKVRQSGVPCAE
jgi:hypothetical protein